jgi:hypothetical protein
MKYLVTLILSALFAFPALAQDRPQLTPLQKLNVANGVTAVVLGPVILPAAMLTGNKEGLCNVLGGTYTPNSDGKSLPSGSEPSGDQCPGGVWLRILPYLAEAGK